MSDVFFSYKREERAQVLPIINALKAEGFSVWHDSNIRVTANFIREVNQRLGEAKCVVVAWSSLAVQSDWVLSEAYEGFERRCLAPLRIDNVRIPIPFAAIETHDLRRWSGDLNDGEWRRLAEGVKAFCRSLSSPLPIAPPAAGDVVDIGGVSLVTAPEPAASQNSETERARRLIVEELGKSPDPVSMARLAHLVQIAFPKTAGKENWFGHKRFGDFLDALQIPDVVVEKRPDARVKLLAQPSAPKPAARPPVASEDEIATKLFNLTEAPLLEPAEYHAVFKGILFAISAGNKGLAPITSTVRDNLRNQGLSVGRQKISYILKGAMIAGLQTEAVSSVQQIGDAFASSLYRQCAARGWELSLDECEHVLRLLGFQATAPGGQ